jgi:serine/threonine-protein kinase
MFEDGEVERTFEVALVETGSGGIASGGGVVGTSPVHQASYVAPKAPSTTSPPAVTQPSTPLAPPPGGGGGGGAATLNINSIPVSNVLLDGRPVGTTPRMNVHVSAGSHVVTFVNGTDRKASSVTVSSGETKTVAVRF